MEGMTVHAVQPILNPTCPSQPQQRTPTMLPLKPSFLSAPTYPPPPSPGIELQLFCNPRRPHKAAAFFLQNPSAKYSQNFCHRGPRPLESAKSSFKFSASFSHNFCNPEASGQLSAFFLQNFCNIFARFLQFFCNFFAIFLQSCASASNRISIEFY